MAVALTPKQQRFVDEYLVDLNATQAAIRAGYSAKTARQVGAENLSKPAVAFAIQERQQKRAEKVEVTAERVLKELAVLAFLDPADMAAITAASGPEDIAALPEHVRRAVAGWSWDKAGNFVVKLNSKQPALEALGRHLGMFKDKVEHSGPDGGPIELSDTERAAKVAAILDRARKRKGGG